MELALFVPQNKQENVTEMFNLTFNRDVCVYKDCYIFIK